MFTTEAGELPFLHLWQQKEPSSLSAHSFEGRAEVQKQHSCGRDSKGSSTWLECWGRGDTSQERTRLVLKNRRRLLMLWNSKQYGKHPLYQSVRVCNERHHKDMLHTCWRQWRSCANPLVGWGNLVGMCRGSQVLLRGLREQGGI